MDGRKVKEALHLQPLTEDDRKNKHILGRLYGPIATCSKETRNGRQYNRELWEKALNDDVFKEKVANKSLFLELGHPEDREETDMTKVCACIPEMPKIIGDDLYAYIDILDTPNGRLLKTLCDYGFVPGISSRGSGTVDDNNEVDPDSFYLETWDIVQLPALKEARLSMTEGLKESLDKKVAKTIFEEPTEAGRKVMTEALQRLYDRHKKRLKEARKPEAPKARKLPEAEELPTEDGLHLLEPFSPDDIYEVLKDLVDDRGQVHLAVEPEDDGSESVAIRSLRLTSNDGETPVIKYSTVDDGSKALSAAPNGDSADGTEGLKKALGAERKKTEALVRRAARMRRRLRTVEQYNTLAMRRAGAAAGEAKKLRERLIRSNSLLKEARSRSAEDDKTTDRINSLLEQNRKLKLDGLKTKKLLESYRGKCSEVLNRYIDTRAKMLGVGREKIVESLGDSYTLDDIDNVCKTILHESKPPRSLPQRIREVKVNTVAPKRDTDDGYDVDDSLLELAGLK